MGPGMQAGLTAVHRFDAPHQWPSQVGVHLVAIVVVGLGAGALIVSGLGAGTGELLAAAASDRSGRPEAGVRVVFEATWLVFGVALGGPVGVGTVLVALLIGPSVQRGYRWVDAAVAASRRQFALAIG